MEPIALVPPRRTSADVVFETLYDQIISLSLLPGDKLSEAEIAKKFGVSRQPVRDAFNRLGNLDLLSIRPQRATRVQKFSLSTIDDARFVRLAVELEIAREAVARWTPEAEPDFLQNLTAQQQAVAAQDTKAFHALDVQFHELVALVADRPSGFALVLEKKAMVDRICVLSLKAKQEMETLLQDHTALFGLLKQGDMQGIENRLRLHLSRIDRTIATIRETHGDYFQS